MLLFNREVSVPESVLKACNVSTKLKNIFSWYLENPFPGLLSTFKFHLFFNKLYSDWVIVDELDQWWLEWLKTWRTVFNEVTFFGVKVLHYSNFLWKWVYAFLVDWSSDLSTLEEATDIWSFFNLSLDLFNADNTLWRFIRLPGNHQSPKQKYNPLVL